MNHNNSEEKAEIDRIKQDKMCINNEYDSKKWTKMIWLLRIIYQKVITIVNVVLYGFTYTL